jgi:hypothetical protein
MHMLTNLNVVNILSLRLYSNISSSDSSSSGVRAIKGDLNAYNGGV